MSLQFETSRLADAARAAGLSDVERAILPLGLFRKSLFFSLDVRDGAGNALTLVSADTDSAMAAEMCIASVASSVPVSPRIRDVLFHTVRSNEGVSFWEQLDRRIPREELTVEEDTWLLEALASAPFKRLTSLLAINYIPAAIVDLGARDTLLKIQWIEAMPALDNEAPVPAGRSQAYVTAIDALRATRERLDESYLICLFEVPDFGWARSEHVRIEAPPETFLSDQRLLMEGVDGRLDVPSYEHADSSTRASFYLPRSEALRDETGKTPQAGPREEGTGRTGLVSYFVRPSAQHVVSPTMTLAWSSFGLLLTASVAEFATQRYGCPSGDSSCFGVGYLWGAASNADAVVTILLIAATLTVAYIVRSTGEHPVRTRLLRPWRHRALWCLGPPVAAALLFLGPRALFARWGLGLSWLVLSALSLVLALALTTKWRSVIRAAKVAENLDGSQIHAPTSAGSE